MLLCRQFVFSRQIACLDIVVDVSLQKLLSIGTIIGLVTEAVRLRAVSVLMLITMIN